MASFTVRADLNAAKTLAFDTLALIVGKAKNLKALNYESKLKGRLGSFVSDKLWSEAISTISKSGSASIPLYLNFARVRLS